MSRQKDLERRLADDEIERNSHLAAHGKDDVEIYYWGAKARFGARGNSALPGPGRSVWRQLLLTPALIVDILPVPHRQFVEYYGMDATQMLKLAEKGYIIPNFYHFKNNKWRNYAKYPSITKLLANYGRANTLWIKEYLSVRYDFESIENDKTDFFININNKLGDAEVKQLMEASHGRIEDWASFATVYGQRLAYIHAIGGNKYEGAVKWIEKSFETPGLRVTAITTLNAIKNLIASETTAAYGGQSTDVEENVQDFSASLPYLRQLVPASDLAGHEMRDISPEVHAYVQDVVRRLAKVEVPEATRIKEGKSDRLGTPAFEQLQELLKKLKKEDGPLGRHINNLTEEIISTGKDLEPTLQSLRKLEAEIESEFWHFRGLRKTLDDLGSTLTRFGVTSPDYSDPHLSMLAWASGAGAELLAKFQSAELEMIPIRFRSRPRRLYADWKKVKRLLLSPPSDNSEGR